MIIASFNGLPFASLSPYLLILLISIPSYILTTIHEEKVLKGAFGEKFMKYEKKVGMFLIHTSRKMLAQVHNNYIPYNIIITYHTI
ncbi:hypothetical protein ES705_09907 [subsurface metagenome]